MKHFLLFLALTMLPIMAAAQRKTNLRIPQNAIFYNSNGKGVSQQREAAFYRVLAIDDKGQKMFYDYTMNGQLKAEKHYKSISKTDDKKTILHGVALVYNASGKLESIMQYSNGQAHGRAVSFFPNGNIGMKLNYRNGLLNGKSYTYSENGNLQYSTLWRNGTKVSEQRGGNDEYIDWKTGKDPFCDNNRVYEQAAVAAPKPKKQNTT
ncbi:toxin-antitoxin system YwqK family antitoxin, partial [Prevotella disiens]